MRKVLCIETATEVCSVCLAEMESGKVLWEETTKDGFQHAHNVTYFIQNCLDSTQTDKSAISAIALSHGPGSYTGLRIGASIAKGLAYGLGIPLLAIDTLEALASAARKEISNPNAVFLPMIDARRMEVYTAPFDSDGKRLAATTPVVLTETTLFEELLEAGKEVYVLGNGAEKCKALPISKQIEFLNILCSSVNLVSRTDSKFIAKQFEEVAYYVPFYMKPPNITKSKKVLL